MSKYIKMFLLKIYQDVFIKKKNLNIRHSTRDGYQHATNKYTDCNHEHDAAAAKYDTDAT